jgi:two-component system response regulator AlgR
LNESGRETDILVRSSQSSNQSCWLIGRGIGAAWLPVTMRVLIADDSDSIRLALRLALEYLGHEVVGLARNSREAVRLYRRQLPQVVLLDVRMPGVDGLRCARHLRHRDPQAKVVILTGGRTTPQQAKEAGARALMEKPFDIYELGDLIRAVGHAN